MEHLPVLLTECIEHLNIKPSGIYVDGTLGYGGHTVEIAKRLIGGKLIAIDRDTYSITASKARLAEYSGRIEFVHGNFRNIEEILCAAGIDAADGMLFDLGVSSPQLDDGGRGFSYMHDAPLDMRMNTNDGLSAFDVVNNWDEDRLRGIFFDFGEERYSGSIARAIVKRRAERPVRTTFELNGIILSAIPSSARHEAQHPSKRCFQALRIAVNDELGAVSEMLKSAPLMLKSGGRLCVISFHSLEDRLVKNAFLSHTNGCRCPKDFPVCVCGFKPDMKIVTRKPIVPGEEELKRNPRARSAKLRAAEKL